MKVSEILPYIKKMEELKVSVVARSSRGFLYNYMKADKEGNVKKFFEKNTPGTNTPWRRTRENFIKRHLAQYKQNPTPRRRLALIAWAYIP